MSIAVRQLSKQFGQFVALSDVSLDVPSGSLLALLGPSGSGKTTLLRIIAGLESPDRGIVLHHDEDVTERSPKERNVGFVFQHYALFRHMSVFENIAFGLRDALNALGSGYTASVSGTQLTINTQGAAFRAIVTRGRPDRRDRSHRCDGCHWRNR